MSPFDGWLGQQPARWTGEVAPAWLPVPERNKFPRTAAEVAAMFGYGTFTAGWLCDDASGALQPVFGSPALTAVNSPTYRTPGPLPRDYAVSLGADNSTNAFSAGDTFDMAAWLPAALHAGIISHIG